MTAPESPDTPLSAPVAAVEDASGATEPANACGQQSIITYDPEMVDDGTWPTYVDRDRSNAIAAAVLAVPLTAAMWGITTLVRWWL